MALPVLAALPDDLRTWEGNIHELAAKCAELRPALGLADDTIIPNERLLRHYQQAGILSAPLSRQGREAVFGGGHVLEYLVARYLISKEGWRLGNVADINRESNWHAQLAAAGSAAEGGAAGAGGAGGLDGMAGMAGMARTPGAAGTAEPFFSTPLALSETLAPETDAQQAIRRIRKGASASAAEAGVPPPARWAAQSSLHRAAAISSRRAHLKDALIQLGNPAGKPELHRMIRLRLTPWCEVHVDATALAGIDEGTADLLGQALTHALREERLRNKGEKS